MTKRLCLLLLCLVFFPGFARAAHEMHPPLRIHAWVDYFPAWLTEAFTKETGIPVQQTFFADNGVLHRNLVEEGALQRYDLITPSGELVETLIQEGRLLPLEKAAIPSLRDMDPWFAGHSYDPGAVYSAPLFWGVLGLLMDKRLVPEEIQPEITGYKDLWRPELKGMLMLPNDFRSVMSVMLLSLGYSVNDPAPGHLEEAMQKLDSLAPSIRMFNTVDQFEGMSLSSVGLGVVWGRELYADPGFAEIFTFIFPEEGSPIWVDTLAVPTTAANPAAAYRFIDFVLRPENLARLSEASGYAVAGLTAKTLTNKKLTSNPAVYPPWRILDKLEVEHALPLSDSLLKRWITIHNRF